MPARRIAIYYAWSRPDETGAPLDVIENRFPALFESRRMLYPRFEELSDPSRFDHWLAMPPFGVRLRAASTASRPSGVTSFSVPIGGIIHDRSG
ncbi:hypothetical protein [Rhizobium leguminosarum]|uniref:hypothetical protein n=1 Tax=Rhizobium leguminosarum TaxID=384 RepID=UPI00098F55C8|nr:hypothetical protein [Rhizobium leguminosarum]ASS58052.1 hypothetical protein CHR56_25795 [Rhizobium leguminosarum bv. viciae]MBB4329979.1 hypothetical protein [Rhizobium leguminosarum]MBB4355374.1 hypothetical protein [Rhizobium leguminosarum]MBB4389983.1 hypothetical protein [Rhizobium leguminosarum]MBB4550482.1 hypothetical protein [Rhizobium leguminosarum]